jgi:hypothetical protein
MTTGKAGGEAKAFPPSYARIHATALQQETARSMRELGQLWSIGKSQVNGNWRLFYAALDLLCPSG